MSQSSSKDRYLALRLGPSASQRLRLNSQTATPLSSGRLSTNTFTPSFIPNFHQQLRTPTTPTRRGDITPSRVCLTLGSRRIIRVRIDAGDSSSTEGTQDGVSESESDMDDDSDSSLASFQRRLFGGGSHSDSDDSAIAPTNSAPGPCHCQCCLRSAQGAAEPVGVAASSPVGDLDIVLQPSPGPGNASVLQNSPASVNPSTGANNSDSVTISESPLPVLCAHPSPSVVSPPPRGSAANPIWVASSPPTLHHVDIPRPNTFPLHTVSSRSSTVARRSPYQLRARRPIDYHRLSTGGRSASQSGHGQAQHQAPVPDEPLVPGPWNDLGPLWTPSPPRPAISNLSGISRRVRISRFDPARPPRNNISTLYALGSALGPGVTLRQFGRLFNRCLQCGHYSFVDNLDDHRCPEDAGNHVNVWPQRGVDELDLTNFLFAEECPGLTPADLQAIFATCDGSELLY